MSIANASEAASAAVGTGGTLMSLVPMILIFAIFYFFLIRPQVKRQRLVENMITELKKGDKVVAAGGLYGVIHKIEDNIIYLEIAENTRIKALKSSVTEVLAKDGKSVDEKSDDVKAANNDDKPKKIKEKKA